MSAADRLLWLLGGGLIPATAVLVLWAVHLLGDWPPE